MKKEATKSTKCTKETREALASSFSCSFVPFVVNDFGEKATTKYTKNTKECREFSSLLSSSFFSCPFVPFVAISLQLDHSDSGKIAMEGFV